ncbi:hypothetical protein B0H13DRAFT_2054973 [Mycena leptocephala]|nr:hypothetical protein B0H13DRAFT_2054973 [Mycena leptocephala]
MNARHYSEVARELEATPSKYIESARRQSTPGLASLLDLFMVWQTVPKTMELGIVDMLLSHLRADKAPLLTPVPRPWQLDADFANLSLVALGNIERFLDDPKYRAHTGGKAWGTCHNGNRVASDTHLHGTCVASDTHLHGTCVGFARQPKGICCGLDGIMFF